MKSVARGGLGVVLVLLLAWSSGGCRHAAPRAGGGLEIGAAEFDITPPVGYRLAGYFNERLATGTHDPLKAKAIVLRQGREQVALVFCDLVGVSLELTAKARARAGRLTGIPVTNIVISATHSHTGPLLDGPLRQFFHDAAVAKHGTDPQEPGDYPALLLERLVKAIAAAQARLRPAELAVGVTPREGLTFNRRYWMKNGKVAFNPGFLNPNIVRPAGPTDPTVGILLARDAATGQPFAGATVFAMHSDTVGGTEFSADYEYYLERTLRRGFGSNYISAFAAGTCGDLNHIDVSKAEMPKGFAMAEYAGSALGRAVLEAAPALRVIDRPALAVRSRKLYLPLQTVTPVQIAEARTNMARFYDPETDFLTKVAAVKTLDLASRGSSWPMEVQVIRLDARTALVCLPCEIFVELGLAIKRGSPFEDTQVLSICNDRPSYVPTEKAFKEGSYEITNARVAPGTGEKLVETALKLLRELSEPK